MATTKNSSKRKGKNTNTHKSNIQGKQEMNGDLISESKSKILVNVKAKAITNAKRKATATAKATAKHMGVRGHVLCWVLVLLDMFRSRAVLQMMIAYMKYPPKSTLNNE